MIEWVHDFINNKATFQYSIISIMFGLAVTKYFSNANKAEFFAALRKELGIKKDETKK